MEPWGTPLVLINTSNCLPEFCYLLRCTVYTIVVLVGDRNTTNLPLRRHLHLGVPKMLESLWLLFLSLQALKEPLQLWSKELHHTHISNGNYMSSCTEQQWFFFLFFDFAFMYLTQIWLSWVSRHRVWLMDSIWSAQRMQINKNKCIQHCHNVIWGVCTIKGIRVAVLQVPPYF